MKTNLTPEQSQRLIELGVDPSKASSSTKVYEQLTEKVRWESKVPIFTLADILSLLPKQIEYPNPNRLEILYPFADTGEVMVRYGTLDDAAVEADFIALELIDALFELLCCVLQNYPDKSKTMNNEDYEEEES